ncbi:SOS response-associated peptidase [Asticcacaulis benevestitus]|uniref:SOS response-associated peptidase n=1 Tax=Asticcacaulis benevestitus TaxID=347481 RepID=UPI0012FCA263|nr:SOS response-associated peptidase family protein [Asticcacaulis benevestitus]
MLKTRSVKVWARNSQGIHELKDMQWRLIPASYAAVPELYDGNTTHARLETVHEKPAFADCWRRKWRCLFPMTSFSQTVKAGTSPFGVGRRSGKVAISRSDGQPLGVAGIYNAIKTSDGTILSAAMLTRQAGPQMAQFHDREPLIIEPGDFIDWLDGSDALDLLTPWADDAFIFTSAA